MSTFRINEIFYSIQGEGVRAGIPHIFIRFSGCNESCLKETHGFDCDTEFVSGRDLSLEEIFTEISKLETGCRWVLLTGGEPGLQVTSEFLKALHDRSFKVAIETNGSIKLPDGIDWICVSPKSAEHTLRQLTANEVKYVRAHGQEIPKTRVAAEYKLISPAFEGENLSRKNLEWCLALVKENPEWRLSVQQHKFWKVR